MRSERGDLWKLWEQGHKIVVTTNVGWEPGTLRNNMGAGMALQAALRWPWLPEWYGSFCRLWVTRWSRPGSIHAALRTAPLLEHDGLRLIFLPVKPLLSYSDPELSWNQRARLDCIQLAVSELRKHHGTIAFGLPGCGNGGLSAMDVRPMLEESLPEERFLLCDREL